MQVAGQVFSRDLHTLPACPPARLSSQPHSIGSLCAAVQCFYIAFQPHCIHAAGAPLHRCAEHQILTSCSAGCKRNTHITIVAGSYLGRTYHGSSWHRILQADQQALLLAQTGQAGRRHAGSGQGLLKKSSLGTCMLPVGLSPAKSSGQPHCILAATATLCTAAVES